MNLPHSLSRSHAAAGPCLVAAHAAPADILSPRLVHELPVGGTTIALVCALRRTVLPFSARLAGDLGRLLPTVFAFTITLGVAPLLFLQVMYGQFLLYASSILIGVPWLAIIGIVILAYYGVYFFSMKGEQAGRRQFWR